MDIKSKKTAAIILNRNLPVETERLRDVLMLEKDVVDVFIVESGSDPERLASGYNFYADWDEAMKNGLRYPAGMNYGLYMIRNLRPGHYGSYLLLANDTIIITSQFVEKLREDLHSTPHCGLVSPCGEDWGERRLLGEGPKGFWHIHNNCYMISESLIGCLAKGSKGYQDYLFDSSNFRGFGTDSELIAKAYINDFMSIITPHALIREDESLLKERFSLIKTESLQENWELYVEEGRRWMRAKYGFTSHWDMNNYGISAYRQFFTCHPSMAERYYIL